MHDTDTLRLVGTTIDGKYHIDAIAGAGGAATVYRATHVTWGRTVAVKVIRSLTTMKESARPEVLAKLVVEAELLASLSEKTAAIVQAYDIGTLTTAAGEWAPYLVLSWLSGATLEAVLEEEEQAGIAPRSLAQAVALLTPAANALALAHARGIAHRDIKPGNLFVTGAPRGTDASIKVLDFGIAKVVADAKSLEGFNATLAGLTSFTPAYGAPEQFSKAVGPTGPWTDVYGLALVVLEVATARGIATGDDIGQLAYATTRVSVRPTPRQLGMAVTDEVEAVLARALAVRIADRYQNAGAFWAALTAALGVDVSALPSSISRISIPDAARSSQRRIPLAIESAATLPVQVLDVPETPPSAPSAETAGSRRRPRRWTIPATLVGVTLMAATAVTLVHLSHAKPHAQPMSSTASAVVAPPPPVSVPPGCPDGMVMIDGGKFFMGSDEADAMPQEKPQHKVILHAYCIDRTEVTLAAYKSCSDTGGCKRAGVVNVWPGISTTEQKTYDPLCNASAPDTRGTHPVNCVDHAQADNYCHEHGKRLPTEAEWELSARGPDGRRYPWGDEAPSSERMNACGAECARWGKSVHTELPAMFDGDDGWVHTAPVGSYPAGASRYGLVDVVGNVWEWVSDGYAPYAQAEATSPTGKEDAPTRVIRGGAWNGSEAGWVRPTFRYGSAPTVRSHGIGFRCAADVK